MERTEGRGSGRPITVSRRWEEYESVKTWRAGLEESTYKPYYYLFVQLMQYLEKSGTRFAEMNPDQLIDFQLDASRHEQYEILKLVQTWAQSDREARKGHIQKRVKMARSFFASNHADLPQDKRFRARSDTPPLPSGLKVEDIKAVVDHSNLTFRAIYISMFESFMDQDTLVRWSNTCWKSLKEQLDKSVDQVLIKIPGRKDTKNGEWFETRLGGDGLQLLRDYLKDIRGSEPGPIFLNQFREPISEVAIHNYWTRKLKDLHRVERQPGKQARYGKGVHQLRDVARSLWQMNAPDSIALCETMMGHEISGDVNGYVHLSDESWKREKYAIMLPYLNLWSSSLPYGLVPKEDMASLKAKVEQLQSQKDERIEALEAANAAMAERLAAIDAQLEKQRRRDDELERRRRA